MTIKKNLIFVISDNDKPLAKYNNRSAPIGPLPTVLHYANTASELQYTVSETLCDSFIFLTIVISLLQLLFKKMTSNYACSNILFFNCRSAVRIARYE